MNLLDRFIDWLRNTTVVSWIYERWELTQSQAIAAQTSTDCAELRRIAETGNMEARLEASKRALELGCEWAKARDSIDDYVSALPSDPSERVARIVQGIGADPRITEALESVGAVVYDTIINMALPDPDAADASTLENVRKFIGTVTLLSGTPGAISSAIEFLTAGQVDHAGDLVQNVYWNLGLGFVTWQMTAPLIEAGIGSKLGRYANRLYRPQRFSESQAMDLLALGERSPNEVRDYLRDEGWQDDDIQSVINLAYRRLSLSQISQAWSELGMPEDWVEARIRELGYDPDIIPVIMDLERPEDVTEERKTLLSTLTGAFKDGLLPEAEFRQLLAQQGYSEREINLRVARVKLDIEESGRRATKSDVEAAYKENVIGTPEVFHWLRQAGYDDESIRFFIDTWDAEQVPEVRKLNRTTILDAWHAGLIDRGKARELLMEVGYSSSSANLILDADQALREQSERVEPQALSRSLVTRAWEAELITREQAISRLGELGFSPEDAELILRTVEVERAQAEAVPTRLPSQSLILNAFFLQQLTRGETLEWLEKIGFTREVAELVLATAEAARAEAEAEEPRQLTPNEVESLYFRGLIDRADAKRRLIEAGFGEADAELLLAAVDQAIEEEAEEEVRALTPAAIIDAWLFDVIDEAAALAALVELGFSRGDASTLIDTAKAARAEAERVEPRRLTRGFIERAYSQGLIDRGEAANRLEEIGFSPPDADLILKSVDEAQAAAAEVPPRPLTRSLVVNTFANGLIEEGEAVDRLAELGYSEADASLILENATLAPPEPERQPTVGAWLTALQRGIVTEELFRSGMRELGFDDASIRIYESIAQVQAPEREKHLTRPQLVKLYTSGRLERTQALRRIVGLGYDVSQADEILFLAEDRLTPNQYLKLVEAFGQDRQGMIEALMARGFSRARAVSAIEGAEPRMSAQEYLRYYQLGGIDRLRLTQELGRLGYDTDAVELLIMLSESEIGGE